MATRKAILIMLFRARDTAGELINDVSTYPREVDFPLHSREVDDVTLYADIINMNDGLIYCRDDIDYSNIHPVTGATVRCHCISKQFISPTGRGLRRFTNVTYYTSDVEDLRLMMIKVTYIYPARIGVIGFNNGTISIGGKPSVITTKMNAIIENRSILSFLMRNLSVGLPHDEMLDVAPPSGWSRDEVSKDDVCIIPTNAPFYTAVLSDWIIDHDELIKDIICATLNKLFEQDTTNLYKVTWDADGRGYVEFVYHT